MYFPVSDSVLLYIIGVLALKSSLSTTIQKSIQSSLFSLSGIFKYGVLLLVKQKAILLMWF